ncbi:hypothetical protein N7495_001169 [Penicillium taxi]|uniref:uncharacterized protein n=1 Tax=Penicillium taxi TaxID=168475 RepID=UPI002544F826|nr:uncharacterized protein N7495_001169 [Penicillium taxi]KAJ5908487.1 hypothetical protein N7495_001169 [Penicillium taxi]
MEETIAELKRQLKEERQAREAEERREEEERKAREEAERLQREAERRLEPNTPFHLFDRCHNSLSQAIQVETDATHDTGRRDWPNRTNAFTSRPLFPSDEQTEYVATNIQNRPIYSEASLRNFERDTVGNFVEKVLEALLGDEPLRHEFGIQGRVTFYDRANLSETLLENILERMNLRDARTPQRPANTSTTRKRNRRADQFCVHLVADERQIPAYAVEFKAPHKVTIPELVAGLHQMDLDRDIIDQEGDTFEFYATYLVAAVVTQIFSYMIDSGVQYGYICTGEAFAFLQIPKDHPTVVQYFMCIPNQDVQADDEWRLQWTAIG